MKEKRILIVDADAGRRGKLGLVLRQRGMEASEAGSCEQALQLLEKDGMISLLLTETDLPDGNGLFLLRRAKELQPEVEVIPIAHQASSSQLLQALHEGAFDFIVRSVDSGEVLLNALERALAHIDQRRRQMHANENLRRKNHALERALKWQKALNASARQVAATNDISDLFRLLLTISRRELEARRGFLALFDRASGQLGLKVCEGIADEVCRKFAGTIPDGFLRSLAQRGKPVAVAGALPEKLMKIASAEELENLLSFPGLLAAPMRLKDQVVGVVVVSGAPSAQAYGEHELNFLVQLTQQVSLALEKAGVIHRLKREKESSATA